MNETQDMLELVFDALLDWAEELCHDVARTTEQSECLSCAGEALGIVKAAALVKAVIMSAGDYDVFCRSLDGLEDYWKRAMERHHAAPDD